MVGKKASSRALSAIFVLAAALALTACLTTSAFAAADNRAPAQATNTCAVVDASGSASGDYYYNDIADALTDVLNGDYGTQPTIYLLDNVTYDSDLDLDGSLAITGLTIDLKGFDLTLYDGGFTFHNLTAENSFGLDLKGQGTVFASTVTIQAGGTLQASANFDVTDAVAIMDSNATITGNIRSDGSGIDASGSSTNVTFDGNIVARMGIYAENGAQVSGSGSITASGTGIYAYGSSVIFEGDINAADCGISAYNAEVDLTGAITTTNPSSSGVVATGGASVTVHKGLITVPNDSGTCITASGSGTEVQASDDIAGCRGITASSGAKVALTGNILAVEWGVYSYGNATSVTVGGNIKVTGDVNSYGDYAVGVLALDFGTALVNGNIDMTGADGTGAEAANGGQATLNGTITAPHFVGFGDVDTVQTLMATFKTAGQGDPTSQKSGYTQYSFTETALSQATAYIWVKAAAPLAPGQALDLIPGTGDSATLISLAAAAFLVIALAFAGMFVAMRRSRQKS